MGGLINLLSHPVITGFVNAAALLIIISQIPAITGITINQGSSPLIQLMDLVNQLSQTNILTLSIGLAALAFLLLSKPLIGKLVMLAGVHAGKDHPLAKTGPLWAALGGIAAVSALGLSGQTNTVGLVPSGLPSLTWPAMDLALWLALLPSAAVIAVITYIESYSIGATLAAKERYQVRPNQELVALGAANVGAALSGAYPVAGSFSRSGVNYAAGARTPVSTLICALIIVVTLMFFTDAFVNLPKAALAAIVMVSVLNLVDLKNSRKNWAVIVRLLDRVGHRSGRFSPRGRNRFALWRRVIHRFFSAGSATLPSLKSADSATPSNFAPPNAIPSPYTKPFWRYGWMKISFLPTPPKSKIRIVGRALQRQDITDVLWLALQ